MNTGPLMWDAVVPGSSPAAEANAGPQSISLLRQLTAGDAEPRSHHTSGNLGFGLVSIHSSEKYFPVVYKVPKISC